MNIPTLHVKFIILGVAFMTSFSIKAQKITSNSHFLYKTYFYNNQSIEKKKVLSILEENIHSTNYLDKYHINQKIMRFSTYSLAAFSGWYIYDTLFTNNSTRFQSIGAGVSILVSTIFALKSRDNLNKAIDRYNENTQQTSYNIRFINGNIAIVIYL